jgi:predicted dehydrogenase
VGGIGGEHRIHLSALERQNRIQLVAVADPAVQRLASEKAAMEQRGVRWHTDYREMLASECDLDAVQISTPIPLHFEMATECMKRGLIINLEKPPVAVIQQLDRLLATEGQERISVGFQQISSVQVQRLKQWILEGKLGELREIRISACWPRLASYYHRPWAGKMMMNGTPVFDGPASNAMAHLIHNVMFFAGETQLDFNVPATVQCELYRVRPTIESYDLMCLRGQFASGLTFVVSLTHVTEACRPFRIEVRGTRDWARISDDGIVLESSAGVHSFPGEKEMSPSTSFARYHSDFIDFVQNLRSRPPTRLSDTRGFLLTTNGGLISSGGIHEIDPRFYSQYSQNGDGGYNVRGLVELMDRSFEEGLLFSEMGAPWAKATKPVSVEKLTSLDVTKYMGRP